MVLCALDFSGTGVALGYFIPFANATSVANAQRITVTSVARRCEVFMGIASRIAFSGSFWRVKKRRLICKVNGRLLAGHGQLLSNFAVGFVALFSPKQS